MIFLCMVDLLLILIFVIEFVISIVEDIVIKDSFLRVENVV